MCDVLLLILSSLRGQDIARCIGVCRSFADLIHSDLYLQYRIELAQNGMVDGEYSDLPVSERLERLRQYSSNFMNGTFQHEDLTAHPDYILQERDLLGPWPWSIVPPERPSSALYKKGDFGQDRSALHLSLFVPGSAQGGVPSSRSLLSVREMVKPDMVPKTWAMDDTQDLFVMVEMTRISHQEDRDGRIPEVYFRFYSLSGLETDTVTPHPAATLPFIHLHFVDSAKPKNVLQLQVSGDYVFFEIRVEMIAVRSYFIHVYNWKTGQMVLRINVGKNAVSIIPLDEPYLLLSPFAMMPELSPNLMIHSFSPSLSESVAGRYVCTLQLPPVPPEEHILWSQAHTGDRAEETTGHFRVDSSRSIVALYTLLEGIENENGVEDDDDSEDDRENENEHATCLLIPRATLAAQIHATESTSRQRDGGNAEEGSEDTTADQPEPMPLSVPWADWGPRGCLRLHLRSPLFRTQYHMFPTPFGSRLPVVMFDEPQSASAFMYVFDVNPLVARSLQVQAARQRERDESESDLKAVNVDDIDTPEPRRAAAGMTAVVEDIEDALPGVVDPECAAIPYAVYRFPLPYFRLGSGPVVPDIRAVTMSMAGFTVQFDDSVEYEKRFQTSTV